MLATTSDDHLRSNTMHFHDSCKLLMILLSIFKIDTSNYQTTRWYGNVRGLFALGMCSSVFALCVFFLCNNQKLIEDVIINLFFCANTFICLCKGIELIAFRHRFLDVIVYLNANLTAFNENDAKIVKTHVLSMKKSNKWTYYVFGLNLSALTLTLVLPVIRNCITNEVTLPVGNSYPLTHFYAVEFSFQAIGYMLLAVISSCFNSLYISFSIFTTNQLDILIYEISTFKCRRNYIQRKLKQNLSKFIEKHVHIIQ